MKMIPRSIMVALGCAFQSGAADDAGMNLVKREKCVYAHCKGHWGQGECPPGQDMPTKDSFKNPFKRGS